jgi:hypothetical protein
MFTALWDQLDSRIAATPDADHDVVPEHLSSRNQEAGRVLEEILALARQQSVSSSTTFNLIVEQLRDQSNQLRGVIKSAFVEGGQIQAALYTLPEFWSNFLEKWDQLILSSKINESGMLQSEELKRLHGAVGELRNPVQILVDHARRSRVSITPPAPSIKNYFSILTKPQHAALGGAFGPPFPPPEAVGEKSDEEPT